MNIDEINILVNKFLESSNKLEEFRKRENIFSILRLHNAEIRHSNFLAWLLNPKENHGLTDCFLQEFLKTALSDKINFDDLKTAKVYREVNNIDLLIETNQSAIIIENKNRSNEGEGQLDKYFEWAEKKLAFKNRYYIYLTLYNQKPSNKNYKAFSYNAIFEIIDAIIKLDSLSERTKIYLEDYLSTLNSLNMGNDEVQNLVNKVYHENKEIIDFIVTKRQDSTPLFEKKFTNFLSNNGYIISSQQYAFVKFYPQELEPYIPKGNGNNWDEAFLFEFFLHSDSEIILRATINKMDLESSLLFEKIFKDHTGFLNDIKYEQWLWCFEMQCDYDRNKILLIHQAEEDNYFSEILKGFKKFIATIATYITADSSGSNKKLAQITKNRENSKTN